MHRKVQERKVLRRAVCCLDAELECSFINQFTRESNAIWRTQVESITKFSASNQFLFKFTILVQLAIVSVWQGKDGVGMERRMKRGRGKK